MNTILSTELLDVPLHRPELVFERANLEEQFRRLRSHVHPDKGGSAEAFAHLQMLYDRAVMLDEQDDWPGILNFAGPKAVFQFDYLTRHEQDACTLYVGHQKVIIRTRPEFVDLRNAGVPLLSRLTFPTSDFALQAQRFLPAMPLLNAKQADGSVFDVYQKTDKHLCLADILAFYGGKMEPRNVAWIVSSLLNINCLLHVGPGYVHMDITAENYFIDPADHNGMLLGGWCFVQRTGTPLRALPAHTQATAGALLAPRKPLATPAVAGALVRAVGRRLLGDERGSKLLMDKTIPRPMLTWLRSPPSADPVCDYKGWHAALHAAYGKRSFHKMELTAKELYAA